MYELLGGTPQRQHRVFLRLGAATIAVIVVVIAALLLLGTRKEDPGLKLTLLSTDIGPGVKPGTEVTLRGVPVGTVRSVGTPSPGDVRLVLGLEQGGVVGLTDSLKVRFQPGNYFGVTQVALMPQPGGEALRSGMQLHPATSSDTISDLLTRSADAVPGILDQNLIDVTKKLAGYTEALTPLLEVAFSIEQKNAQSTQIGVQQTLDTLGTTVEGLPGIIDAGFGWTIEQLASTSSVRTTVEDFDTVTATTGLLGTGFFQPLADLFGSHEQNFTPGSETLQVIMNNTTKVMSTVSIPRQVAPLITGLKRSFVKLPEGTAIRTDLVIDKIPAVASVLPPAGVTAPSASTGGR